jgi:VanZ family protein
MELLDPTASVRECEALYEESLWCLYALQDDVMQRTNPYRDEDMKTIAMCMCSHFNVLFVLFFLNILNRDRENSQTFRQLSVQT